MPSKTYNIKNSVENTKNRTQTGHTLPVSGFKDTPDSSAVISFPSPPEHPESRDKRDKTTIRAGRDSQAYWKTKVKPRVVRGQPTPELYCRLFEGKREAWICCDSSNRGIAADKARNLYLRMKAIGLPALLTELRPDARPVRSSTVGELLKEAKSLTTVRASSLAEYEKSLRRLVAGVLGMKPTPGIYAAGSADSLAWRAKVEGASLDVLGGARVEAWRKQYIDAAPDEKARQSRRNTANAIVRNARGLFTEEIVKGIADRLRLPSPLPLSGLSAGTSTRRFRTTVDPRALYAAARKELKGDELTAFLLCITAGLRRAEVDMLEWENVDLAAGKVEIVTTKWFAPKTEESARNTPIPPDVVKHLEQSRAKDKSADFVLAGLDPNKPRGAKTYRCTCWAPLTVWLRSKGFASLNPIHELRKLSGSLVNSTAGLEAARRHLGHRNIGTTAASYLQGASALVDLSAPRDAMKGANAS